MSVRSIQRRWFRRALALLAACWVVSACAAQDAALQARLEARAGELVSTVSAFYAARGYAPVWTGSPAALARADTLVYVLHTADRDGLRPASYDAARLTKQVQAMRQGQAVDAVGLEVRLSEALVRYVAHLTRGRVAPAALHAGWAPTRATPDLATAVQHVVASASLADALGALAPPYAGYRTLREALAHYRRLAQDGGWPALELDGLLAFGDRGDAVERLHRRLAITEAGVPMAADRLRMFGVATEAAVRAFQRRHGLEPDGIVGPQTRTALNVPVEVRIAQIETSLERWRWLPRPPEAQYLLVNSAGGRLAVVDEGRAVLAMDVIVGAPRTPTPLFHSAVEKVVLAPSWYIPASIAKAEILPRLRRDPGYLNRQGIRRLPGGGLRQEPGPRNPLGRLKFIAPNPFSIGLHDTPARHLFGRTDCAFSHGCIRLEKPVELATFMLRNDTTWTRARIEAVIAAWRETTIPVPHPVPVYVLYWTAWVDAEGTVHFRSDRDGTDAALRRALRQAETVTER